MQASPTRLLMVVVVALFTVCKAARADSTHAAAAVTTPAAPEGNPASPNASQSSAHPDDSPFEIPLLPAPANGFGLMLEQACDALESVTVTSPQAPQPTPATPPAAATSRFSAARADPVHLAKVKLGLQARRTSSAGALRDLADATSGLKDICDALKQGPDKVTEALLGELRAYESAGTFPSFASALHDAAEQKAKARAGKRSEEAREGVDAAEIAGSLQPTAAAPIPMSSTVGLESNLLNGLADFLVTRTKEEAILYLQGEITDTFCKGEAAKVIANTCAAIQKLDPTLSITAMGTALNAAARRDLAFLPDGMLRIASDEDKDHFYVYEPMRLLFAIVRDALGGRLPLELVRSVYAVPPRLCEQQTPPAGADAKCVQAFTVFRLSSASIYAAEASSLDQVAKDPGSHEARIVGAVLDAESRYQTGGMPAGTTRTFAFTAIQVQDVLQSFAALGDTLTGWKQGNDALESVSQPGSTPTDRKRLLGAVVFDVIVRTGRVIQDLAPITVADTTALAQVKDTGAAIGASGALGRDIVTEDYGAIPLDAAALVTSLDSLDSLKKSTALKDVLDELQKFVPLVTEVASAQNSADVSAAFEAAAAPATSFRAKYQRHQFAINALVGGFIGVENPNDPSNSRDLGNSTSSGAVAGFAPVGAEYTFPFCTYFYGGFMASVIDIGALTTARFKSEVSDKQNVTTSANVTFGQVFSPGLYGLIGLGKSPVVIGGGASYAPALRTLDTVDANGNAVSEKVSAMRYGGFVAVDISILPL